MHRSGFTSAVLAEGVDAAAAERQFARFGAFYQGDVHEPRPCLPGRPHEPGRRAQSCAGQRRARPRGQRLVAWALGLGRPSIVTTNFRPFEAGDPHLVTRVRPDVPVVWMDNGYSTEATYRFADEVTRQLGLNLHIYLPRRSRSAPRGGGRPHASAQRPAPRRRWSTEEVKLEPVAPCAKPRPRCGSPRCAPPTPPCAQMEPAQHQPRRTHQGRAAAALVLQRPARILQGPRPAQQLWTTWTRPLG